MLWIILEVARTLLESHQSHPETRRVQTVRRSCHFTRVVVSSDSGLWWDGSACLLGLRSCLHQDVWMHGFRCLHKINLFNSAVPAEEECSRHLPRRCSVRSSVSKNPKQKEAKRWIKHMSHVWPGAKRSKSQEALGAEKQRKQYRVFVFSSVRKAVLIRKSSWESDCL